MAQLSLCLTVRPPCHCAVLPQPSRVLQGLTRASASLPTFSTIRVCTATATVVQHLLSDLHAAVFIYDCCILRPPELAHFMIAAHTTYTRIAGEFEVLAVEMYMFKTAWD